MNIQDTAKNIIQKSRPFLEDNSQVVVIVGTILLALFLIFVLEITRTSDTKVPAQYENFSTSTLVTASTTAENATTSTTTATTTINEEVEIEAEEIVPVPVKQPTSAVEAPKEESVQITNTLVEAPEFTSTQPPVPESVVTSSHISQLLSGHNAARTNKGLSALSWSPTVAASAQAWADVLGDKGCVLEHSTGGPYGENLYYSWTTGSTLNLNPAEAVWWWLDEEQYYNYQKNSCKAGEQCGHYTQAVWADTTEVGCGVAVCTGNGRLTQLWACQYNPPGNWIGERPY